MSDERVSVGSSYSDATFGLAIGGAAIGIIGGLSLFAFAPEWAIGVTGAGLIFGLLALARGYAISRKRRWITPTDEGFTLEDKNGQFDFTDEQISDLGTWAKTRFANGVPKSIERKGSLVIAAESFAATLDFQYVVALNKIDPLEEFLERNLVRLTDEAKANLANGDTIEGKGWTLDAKEMVCTDGRAASSFLVSDFTATDIVDGKVAIWVRGDPKPVVRIAAGSPNALVLVRLLSKQLAEKGPVAEDATGLGRIIFERDKSTQRGLLVFLLAIFVLAAIGGILLAIAESGNQRDQAGLLIGIIIAILAPIFSLLVWFNRINIFRCHTNGVCYIKTRSRKEIAFEDVRVFTYNAVRNYYNGAYTGTVISLNFEPGEGTEGDAIKYSANVKNSDGEIDNLREHVSRVMAGHMRKRFDAGRTVRWTDAVRFTDDGLEVIVPGGVFSKGKNRVVPFAKISGYDMKDGYFFLFEKGKKDVLYSVIVSAPNFFPGLAMLNTILYPAVPKPADDDDDEIPTVQPEREDEPS